MVRQGAFKQVSEQGRERLVPVKRRTTDKTRGRSRPRPILERTLMVWQNHEDESIRGWRYNFPSHHLCYRRG
jgi:hypothetical protein